MSVTLLIGLSLAGALSLLCLSYSLSERWERGQERSRQRAARVAVVVGVGAAALCAVSIVALVLDLSGTGVGSSASSTSARSAGRVGDNFCDAHRCVAGFATGTGSVVQCADREWSHTSGPQQACSGHGGERGAPLR